MGSSAINLDDSDSDDSLLAGVATFSRKRRNTSEDASKAKMNRILDGALQSGEKRREQQRLIAAIKREEEVNEVDLVESARLLQEDNVKKPKSREATRSIVEGIESNTKEKRVDQGRQRALVEAADTQQTASQGFRATISSKFSKDLPSTSIQALEYLQYELLEEASSGHSPGIREELVAKLREGNRHAFLLMDQLFCKDDSQVKAIVPKPLVHWLLLVACTSSSDESMQNLSHGAYLTLLRMMINGNKKPCLLFSFKELPLQLQSWFGVGSCGKCAPQEQHSDDTQESSIGGNHKETLARFLHLWDTAFSQDMVHFDIDISKPATASIVALLLAGLDEMFGSKKTPGNDAPLNLQKLLAHILKAAARRCEDTEQHEEWTKNLVEEIAAAISELGPGAPNAEDADDKDAWLCQARAIRTIVVSSASDEAATLAISLSERVLTECLEVKKDWNSCMLSVSSGWNLPDGLRSTSRWKAMTSSVLALAELNANFDDENGPRCLAIVEIAHLCLQTAVTLFWRAHQRNDQDEEARYIVSAYEQLEDQCTKLSVRTNRLILKDPNLLRVNHYVNCIRQYPRLQRQHFESQPTVSSQATLDTFFTKVPAV